MAGTPKLSPVIQGLIDKGLLDRLPPTFATFFFEQFQQWDLLFPAEQRYQERLFLLLDRSAPEAIESLFAPLREVERRMGINDKTWPRRRFELDQVEFLNQNAHYGEWRQAISGVFGRIDPLLDAEIARKGKPALVVVTAPPELAVSADRMWLRLRPRGKPIPIVPPDTEDYLGMALNDSAGKSILELHAKDRYDSWSISVGRGIGAGGNVVRLSYDELKNYRSRLMEEVRRIVEKGEVRTPQQLLERLKQLNVLASEGDFAGDPVVSEFVRAVLLTGNGTLLINNTFVEWAAIQAIRRARPSAILVSFGVRNKLKPFSSMLIYSDQETASPVPDQMDALGTYVDLEIFYQYIWQEFEKYAEYRNNTAYLFLADGLEELFCIAPPDFPLLTAKAPLKLLEIFAGAKEWLNV
jgi:hypothetical protein